MRKSPIIESQITLESPPFEERRNAQRIKLQVPLFLKGLDIYGAQFIELVKALNISGLGALVTCPRALPVNGLVTLTIPAPSITSSALVPAGMPPIQARVRRQQQMGDIHLVAVEFQESIL